MPDHIYKTTDLIGSSGESVEDAVERALARASKTVRNMRWFEVSEIRGTVDGGKVQYWQVGLRVGFTLED